MTRPFLSRAAALLSLALPSLGHANDTLDVVAAFEIKAPEPATSGHIFSRMGVAETLVNADADGTLTPGLATQWRVSEDGLVWTFGLRKGVMFHDGTAMTADSVVNALTIARGKPGPLAGLPITALEAGEDEVILTLSDPMAALPAFLAEARSQILAPASYAADGAGVAIIGTGPYRITALEPPLSLDATEFDGYWGPPPHISDVTYSGVSRVETRALMAESGEAEFVFGLDPASVSRLGMLDAVEVLSVPIPRTLLIKVNAGHPFLSDAQTRRALSLAIDRTGIAKAVLRYPEGASQLFPPSVAGWHDAGLAPLSYDVEAAKRLLADLGWVPGEDGILTRDGARFALTLTTYADRPELPLIAAVLEQQFRAIGVDVTINTTNSSEIPAGHQSGSLDLGLIARNFSLIPDPIGTVLSDYVDNGDWGAMNWHNAEFASLVRAIARGEESTEDRRAAAAILHADLPIIPVAWYQLTLAVSDRVEGATIDPYERSFGLQNMRWAQ
ncbi:ABC transporter substrate-binding protein [Celeribacter baekdonensis]|uniref:ABC transporter substrate-binding protein n=1 Tax=Celeribacter baekdonensis TaxID=875171 RepID=UPI0030DDB118|tara:strand:- start:126268 stop:127773 length:1506 start_codon:yes stop_codon:yes gene_type:complete